MKKFEIEIEEISQRVEDIKANSIEEALEIAEEKYSRGEIVLDYEDFKGHEIREYREYVRTEDLKKDHIFDTSVGKAILLEGDSQLALIKRLNTDCQPYVIVRGLEPNRTKSSFEWLYGTYFSSLSQASKEYEKVANINQHANDIDFSKLGEKTLENYGIAKFKNVDEIFDFLMEEDMNKEDILEMIPKETKKEIISTYYDSTREEKEEYFFSDSMFALEESINYHLIKIDNALQQLNITEVSPYDVMEILEQKELEEIDPGLSEKILNDIKISIPNYDSTIENFIECVQERLEENQEEEENEI